VLELLVADPRACRYSGARTVVPVAIADTPYQITIGRGLLGAVGEIHPPREAGVRAAVVTSDRIAPLLARRVLDTLAAGGWAPTLIVIPDGEASKSLPVAGEVYEQLAAARLDRGSTVFALGGGVVGDLAGFVAATYMRGIDLVQLPTTLLAQVDSSIGGKTGIDLRAGKNLVGAFHQPRAVISDVDALATLPPAEMRSGLGEVVKHACGFDAEMFAFLEERGPEVATDPAALEYLVARNCQIKAEVVAQDPHEQGLRAVLNYGHTVGHALERAAPDWAWRHGEVVGVGIVAESRLAAWLGIASEAVAQRQEHLVARIGLPVALSGVDVAAALRALERDKKIVAGRLRLPLVPEIGRFEIVEDVDLDLVRRALRSVLA
jgi:3-dehydroquinate synthase